LPDIKHIRKNTDVYREKTNAVKVKSISKHELPRAEVLELQGVDGAR
jgi:hypothetical protein